MCRVPCFQGRTAYLQWREELKQMHSRVVGGLMAEAGYPPEAVAATQAMMLKKGIKASPQAQILEDALCLGGWLGSGTGGSGRAPGRSARVGDAVGGGSALGLLCGEPWAIKLGQ